MKKYLLAPAVGVWWSELVGDSYVVRVWWLGWLETRGLWLVVVVHSWCWRAPARQTRVGGLQTTFPWGSSSHTSGKSRYRAFARDSESLYRPRATLLVTVDLHLQLRQRRPRQGATRGAYYRHASIRLFAEVPASARESWQEGSRLVVRGRRPCATSLSVLLLEYLTTPSPHDFQGSGRGSEFPHRP